jgi:hypothetical protein
MLSIYAIYLLIFFSCVSSSYSSLYRLELVAVPKNKTSALQHTIIDGHCSMMEIRNGPISSANVSGEGMPFSPLDGCTPLSSSPFTQINMTTGAYLPDPWSSNGTPVAAMVSMEGPCSQAHRCVLVATIPQIKTALLIYPENTLPVSPAAAPPDLDLAGLEGSLRSGNSSLSVMVIRSSIGKAMVDVMNWYRTNAVLLPAGSSLSDRVPRWNDNNDTFTFPDNQTSGQEAWFWVRVTVTQLDVPRKEADSGASLGMIEFSLILIVALLAVAFVTSIGLHCYFYHTRARRAQGDQNAMTTELLSEDNLRHLPQRQYHPDPEAAEEEACPICLDEYQEEDVLRELPCGHMYHSRCVDTWLLVKSASCPMCKCNVTEHVRSIEANLNKPPPTDPAAPAPVLSRWKQYWNRLRGCLTGQSQAADAV